MLFINIIILYNKRVNLKMIAKFIINLIYVILLLYIIDSINKAEKSQIHK
jgi:hypothetical protein